MTRASAWALLTALVATNAGAEQFYVQANEPGTVSYTPAATMTGHFGATATPAVSVRRSGTGAYSVSFGGAVLTAAEGNVQVSATEETGNYCKVLSWGGGAANVRCFSANGRPADTRFAVLATRVSGTTPGLGYAWVAGKEPVRVSPDYSYAEGGRATAERLGVGNFRVSLPGVLGSGGNVQVTAYGPDATHCNVGSWSSSAISVRCFSPTGSPADSAFSVLATDSRYTPAGGRISFLWANDASAPTSEPNTQYARLEGDEAVIRRRSAGWYQVTMGGIVSGGGNVQVTAYGSSARCEPAGWAGGSVVVRCRASDGSPVDSKFSLLAVRSGPVRVITPDLPIGTDVPIVVATPTIRQTINVVEHLCINTPCEFGPDGWDKTAAEMEFDGTDTTSFEVDVAGSRLVRLCPVRRRTTDREFAGNGPSIRANSAITRSGQTLRLSTFMEAEETGSGGSYAAKTWNGDLYTAPSGWRISSYEPVRSETSYVDRNHAEDTPPVRGGTLVSEFRFKGDTGGNDTGNCTTDDTYMTIRYNPVTVTLNAQRSNMRLVRIRQSAWEIILESFVTRLAITINNYDRTKSQPENGTPENKYYIDRTNARTWSSLSDAQIRQASFYEFRSAGAGSVSVPATPLPVPALRQNTFTFLLNSIVANGRGNRVAPAGDYIRLTIPFESSEPEVVTACVDNAACGTGEPHTAGKPLVQVDNLRLIPYLRLNVTRTGAGVQVRTELKRIRIEADFARDGTCRNNLFAFACNMLAGNIERIAYEAVLGQVNVFVLNSSSLLSLLDTSVTTAVCQLLATRDEDCQRLENIILDENGDMLMWMRQ